MNIRYEVNIRSQSDMIRFLVVSALVSATLLGAPLNVLPAS
jgi:hypothetical protein